MAIERPKNPRPKNVMVIVDNPTKNELAESEKFSSASNMGLLTALRTGRVNNFKEYEGNQHKGILSTDIFTTYLDYEGFGEDNFDYKKELVKGKDREEGEVYYQLEHQKDVYVAERLWNQFQALLEEIKKVEPKLIIVVGKWSLFFLTGCVSLTNNQGNYKDKKPLGCLNKYRSSLMEVHNCYNIEQSHVLLPIYHTLNALAMPDKIAVITLDLQKAGWVYNTIKEKGVSYYAQSPEQFTITVDKGEIISYLQDLLLRLDKEERYVSVDIETKFSAIIDCVGITDEVNKGICIPFAGEKKPCIWSEEDEIEITLWMFQVLKHPNCKIVAQNFFYDSVFITDMYCVNLYSTHDSMVLHHLLYNYLPKDLSFLASIYAERYSQWKDLQKHR